MTDGVGDFRLANQTCPVTCFVIIRNGVKLIAKEIHDVLVFLVTIAGLILYLFFFFLLFLKTQVSTMSKIGFVIQFASSLVIVSLRY